MLALSSMLALWLALLALCFPCRLLRLLPRSLLRSLGPVFRASLLAVLDALRVEHAAQDVVAHARQVLHAAAADHHHRVLLQIVALTRNVADHLEAIGQA